MKVIGYRAVIKALDTAVYIEERESRRDADHLPTSSLNQLYQVTDWGAVRPSLCFTSQPRTPRTAYNLKMNTNCEYCPHLLRNSSDDGIVELPALCWELFHQPCDSRFCEAILNQSLCPFCQHLRLRHLLICVPYMIWQNFRISLPNGLVSDLASRCSFCNIIIHTVRQADLKDTSTKDTLTLDFGRFHAELGIVDLIWNCFGQGTRFVGKLSISDSSSGTYCCGWFFATI